MHTVYIIYRWLLLIGCLYGTFNLAFFWPGMLRYAIHQKIGKDTGFYFATSAVLVVAYLILP